MKKLSRESNEKATGIFKMNEKEIHIENPHLIYVAKIFFGVSCRSNNNNILKKKENKREIIIEKYSSLLFWFSI